MILFIIFIVGMIMDWVNIGEGDDDDDELVY